MFSQERPELVYDGYKCQEVNERQAALQYKPREPIPIASAKELLDCVHNIVWSR
jgi:hypothetical protein